MKIKITTEEETPYLSIEYEGNEKTKLQEKFDVLGIEPATTSNAWGIGKTITYYRARNRLWFNSLNLDNDYRTNYCDDINSPVFDDRVFNIAVFRVIDESNKVKVQLNEMLTIADINELSRKIATAIEKIYNTITGEVEIKVKTGFEE